MNSVLHYKGYSAKPEYSADDGIIYGKILGISDLVDFYSENSKDVEKEFHQAVDDYLAFCEEIGKDPQRPYSGSFNVRIQPQLHRQLAGRALSEGISLNKAVEIAVSQYLDQSTNVAKVFVPVGFTMKPEQSYQYQKTSTSHYPEWSNYTEIYTREGRC